MTTEKGSDIVTDSHNIREDDSDIQVGQTATIAALGEAADVYGDYATAQEYGYVQRGYVNPQFEASLTGQTQIPSHSIHGNWGNNRNRVHASQAVICADIDRGTDYSSVLAARSSNQAHCQSYWDSRSPESPSIR